MFIFIYLQIPIEYNYTYKNMFYIKVNIVSLIAMYKSLNCLKYREQGMFLVLI